MFVQDRDREFEGTYRCDVQFGVEPSNLLLVERDVRNKTDTQYDALPVEVTSVTGSNVTMGLSNGAVVE